MKTGARFGLSLAMALTLAACGEASQKQSKISTLSNDSAASAGVDADTLWGHRHGHEQTEEALGTGIVEVYNANSVAAIPTPLYRGIKVLSGGQRTLQGVFLPLLVTDDVQAANDNLSFARDFYKTTFNRNSYDGQGATIKAAVEVQQFHLVPLLGMKENAAWMEQFNHFVFGAGGANLGGFAQAIDVVAHEYTHAVVSFTSKLVYVGQSGALNEHLADVFGEMAQHAQQPDSEPFLIGETTLRGEFAAQARALRDMLHPENGLTKQPGHMSEIPDQFGPDCQPASGNDNCGVHTLSGIPNKAAALIIQQLGWSKSEPLFYTVMTERLVSDSTFADYRDLMVNECAQTLSDTDCDKVAAAFAEVGL